MATRRRARPRPCHLPPDSHDLRWPHLGRSDLYRRCAFCLCPSDRHSFPRGWREPWGGEPSGSARILKVMGKAASFAIGNEPSECGISAWFQLVPQMCRTPREAGCVMRWTALPRYGKKTRTGLFFVPSRRRCFPRSYGFPAGNVPVSDNIPAGFAVTFLAHFFACPDLFCYLCAAKPGQLPPMRSDASVTAPAVARLRADGRFARGVVE